MGSPPGFVYRQLTFKPKPLPKSVNLSGKTMIVTGANVGLGLEAAKEMAQHGLSHLILAVRSASKGEVARREILKVAPRCDAQVWDLDYESPASMAAFAERARSLDRVDIVILCAGVKSLEFQLSKGGHEMNVQVNHLGTAALSLLLLPVLRATAVKVSAPSRMLIVTSEVHFWVPFKEKKAPSILARMDEEDSFKSRGIDRYCTTKLLNVLWARELASKVSADEVVINLVNPGLCATSLHRGDTAMESFGINLLSWSAEKGAYTLTDAVTRHADHQGGYLSEQRLTCPSKFVLSEEGKETQKRLWDETVVELAKSIPGFDLSVLLPTT